MKNNKTTIVKISSIQEYRERYFPNKYSVNNFVEENIEEMAFNSAENSFKKYKEALHGKHITRASTATASSKRSN
jgi:hypothetical protein